MSPRETNNQVFHLSHFLDDKDDADVFNYGHTKPTGRPTKLTISGPPSPSLLTIVMFIKPNSSPPPPPPLQPASKSIWLLLMQQVAALRAKGCKVSLDNGRDIGHRRHHRRLQSGKCGKAVLSQRFLAFEAACCPTNDPTCKRGIPIQCSAECALVYFPFYDDCSPELARSPEEKRKMASMLAKCVQVRNRRFATRSKELSAVQNPLATETAISTTSC